MLEKNKIEDTFIQSGFAVDFRPTGGAGAFSIRPLQNARNPLENFQKTERTAAIRQRRGNGRLPLSDFRTRTSFGISDQGGLLRTERSPQKKFPRKTVTGGEKQQEKFGWK